MKYLFYFFCFILFVACSNNKQVEKPEPLALLDEGGLDIPVYNEAALDYLLNKKDDKIHVVNFWATWCGPCIKELPYFEKLNEEHKDKVDVSLISIDMQQAEKTLVALSKRKDLKSKIINVLPEDEGKLKTRLNVDKNWSNGEIPATIIYDKNKRYFINEAVTYEDLVEKINEF